MALKRALWVRTRLEPHLRVQLQQVLRTCAGLHFLRFDVLVKYSRQHHVDGNLNDVVCDIRSLARYDQRNHLQLVLDTRKR